jgi:cell wall-associated NlpC family hydrolase
VADLEPGDLLFYGPDGDDHVAMYVGGGDMIEAPETGQTVHITPIRLSTDPSTDYGEAFAGAGRP